jgi:hypothetical protein
MWLSTSQTIQGLYQRNPLSMYNLVPSETGY